jgi:hypothetical protein
MAYTVVYTLNAIFVTENNIRLLFEFCFAIFLLLLEEKFLKNKYIEKDYKNSFKVQII